MMARKKRYALYLSRPLANKLELVARHATAPSRRCWRKRCEANLEPQQVPGVADALTRRLNELHKAVATTGAMSPSSPRPWRCSCATS